MRLFSFLLYSEDFQASPEKMVDQERMARPEAPAPQEEMAETAAMDLKEAEV